MRTVKYREQAKCYDRRDDADKALASRKGFIRHYRNEGYFVAIYHSANGFRWLSK